MKPPLSRAVGTVALVAVVLVFAGAQGEVALRVFLAHALGYPGTVLAMLIALGTGFPGAVPKAVEGLKNTNVASPLGAGAGGR
ncbi:hypothetical protein SAVIM338S_04399 [Streptomyces avidinii]